VQDAVAVCVDGPNGTDWVVDWLMADVVDAAELGSAVPLMNWSATF